MELVLVIALLAVSFLVSGMSNFLVLNFAKTLGIRNKNNVSIRWSNESKPSLGGISMYIVFLFTGLILSLLFADFIEWQKWEYMGLFLAATLAFSMGIADDAYDTKPKVKLGVQVLCGLVFVGTNSVLHLTDIPEINSIITVLWVIVLMNSLNMLDNMDGITATTCCTILLCCLLVYEWNNGWVLSIWSILMLISLGTLIGFLLFNVHPSKMFMGDGGSQFLGVLIAFFTIKVFFGNSAGSFNGGGVLLALVALTAAAVDTTVVVINRIKKGQSPMVGGKDHTTHFLVYSGFSDRQVWYIFLAIGLISVGVSAFCYSTLKENPGLAIGVGILWFLMVFGYLYRNTIRHSSQVT